jgi:undecaprenyl diphosphate synthase
MSKEKGKNFSACRNGSKLPEEEREDINLQMSPEKVPDHVALIMDGNGRWAEKHGLPKLSGHNAGMKAMKRIVKFAAGLGIKYLTVYAFSTENWKRSEEEVRGIFSLLIKYVSSEIRELDENNIRIRVLGDYEKIPPKAARSLEKLVKTTENNTGMQFHVAVNYGSRQEIIRAVRLLLSDIIRESEKGELTQRDLIINESMISDRLYTGRENFHVPDPDLIIRTSGEIRLSNFMLWQAAYSELAFTDTLWPDFTPEEFKEILVEYSMRDRRFGGRQDGEIKNE